MQRVLDHADSLNRAYIPMTGGVDSLLREATKYYDRHGTPNEQLRAHYLLGCAYRDMGEAPAALQCYQDAVDHADTLSNDCDIRRLMSVYGQMATLFHAQNLPTDEQEAILQVRNCARRQKDTLTYIRSIELMVKPYFLQHDTASMLRALHQAQQLYLKHGYAEEAASVYPLIIDIYIARDSLEAARKLMDVFETKSGLFDAKGNISAGRENYYELKGFYYIHTHNYDSAEYYYRKTLEYNLVTDAYRGLFSVYKGRMNTDSIVKYAQLYEEAVNHEQETLRTQTVHQMSSLYNYQRFSRKADMESRKAARANNRLLVCIIVLLIVLLAASWLYIARRRLIDSLEQTAIELNGIKTENNVLKQDSLSNQQQIAENEKRIKQLEKKLGRYGKLVFLGTEKMDNDLKLSSNYQHIKGLAYKGEKLSECDWDVIGNLASEYYPGFYDFLLSQTKVDSKEYQICLLLRLHFKAGEIANMLGVTPPYISKTSTDILENLYGKKGSSKELSRELSKIY
jgi:hypothetical protein